MNDRNNRNCLLEAKANFQRNIETVGGKLVLFEQYIEFRSHAFNIQKNPVSIALSSISGIESGWTKLFGIIPIFPNSIVITAKNQRQYRFTVSQRSIWISKIEALIGKLGINEEKE